MLVETLTHAIGGTNRTHANCHDTTVSSRLRRRLALQVKSILHPLRRCWSGAVIKYRIHAAYLVGPYQMTPVRRRAHGR